MQECQGSQQDRQLVRKALRSALSHLKADHAADFQTHISLKFFTWWLADSSENGSPRMILSTDM
jgi:hypothetical protein